MDITKYFKKGEARVEASPNEDSSPTMSASSPGVGASLSPTSAPGRKPLQPVAANQVLPRKRKLDVAGPPAKVSKTSGVKVCTPPPVGQTQARPWSLTEESEDEALEADIPFEDDAGLEDLSDVESAEAAKVRASKPMVIRDAAPEVIAKARDVVIHAGALGAFSEDLKVFFDSSNDYSPDELQSRYDAYEKRFTEFSEEESTRTGKPKLEICRPTGSINASVFALLNHPTMKYTGKLPGTTLDPAVNTTLLLIRAGISAENTFVTDMVNRRCEVRYEIDENGKKVQGLTEPKTWPLDIQNLHYRFALETLEESSAKVPIVFGRENGELFDKLQSIDEHYECKKGWIYLGKVKINAGVLLRDGAILKLLIFMSHPQFINTRADKVQVDYYEKRLQFAYRIGGLEVPDDSIVRQQQHKSNGERVYRRSVRAGTVIKTAENTFEVDGNTFKLARDTTHAARRQLHQNAGEIVVAPEFETSTKKPAKDENQAKRLRQLRFQRQVELELRAEAERGTSTPLEMVHPSIQDFLKRNPHVFDRVAQHNDEHGDSLLGALSALFGRPPALSEMFAEDETQTRPVVWTGSKHAPSDFKASEGTPKVELKDFLRGPQGAELSHRNARCTTCKTERLAVATYTNAFVHQYSRDWFKDQGHRKWKSMVIPPWQENALVITKASCKHCKKVMTMEPYDSGVSYEERVDYIQRPQMTTFVLTINTNLHRSDPNAV